MVTDAPPVQVEDLVVSVRDRCVSSVPELVVERGACVALVGESGSGKSSALLAILGLSASMGARAQGRVRLFGVDVLSASNRQLCRIRGLRAAFVAQTPQGALNPTMRLGALLKRSLALHGIAGADAETRTSEAMAGVLLPRRILDRYPHEISGGQAQRFAIALALALGAELIVADEPTSALDVTVQSEILALLLRLRETKQLSLLLVSHDLAVVSTLADRIVVMREGAVVESSPASELFVNPACDYTRELIDAVPAFGT